MSEWQPPQPSKSDLSRKIQYALGLHEQGRLVDAEKTYNEVLRARPRHLDALHLLGLLKHEQGDHREAERLIAAALKVKRDVPALLYNYGLVLEALERHEDALASYNRALVFNPDYVDALFNRGNVLQTLDRYAEALASYDKAIALKPAHADALNNRGNALATLGRHQDALESFDRCLALAPDHVLALFNRGLALRTMGRQKEACDSLEKALALKPDYTEARFVLCMAQLPALYADAEEIDRQRAAYRDRLEALCETVERSGTYGDLWKQVGPSQPFYLAYQGYNDIDLQARYGELVCRIMAARFSPPPLPPKPAPGEPVRVGFVSGFFRNHSNWKIPIKGWLGRLDRKAFKPFCYYTGSERDSETEIAAGLCERFVQGPLSLDQWRQEILSDRPHVLIYPELGMDAVCAQLATQRLAAVQCTSWGHPETSGFPTVDYFLSSARMEPPDGRDHYTERLIELPNLSIYYEPIEMAPAAEKRLDFAMRPDATVYWCGQSLYKYLPQFDHIFPRIAREAGDCQFVFLEFQRAAQVTDLFRQRMARAFAADGLRADDYCIMLNRLSQSKFLAASGLADVVLDTLGWSGCNSTLECLAQDLPIVTMAGPMMRGRHSAAILQMMEVTETVVHSIDHYVATAVRLAKDKSWRAAIKSRIAANKHKIYRDTECIAALASFLDRVARQ